MKSRNTIPIILLLGLILLIPTVSATNDTSMLNIEKVGDNSITVSSTDELINALDNTDYDKIILKKDITYNINGKTINRDLTIESESKDTVTIDAQNMQHIFYIPDNIQLTLNYIKIFNGAGYQSSDTFGGGIVSDGTLIANNCIFDSNYVSGSGGAVIVEGNEARFTNCLFNDNHAARGGAISTYASYGYLPTVYITNCTFTNSLAIYGGAIHIMGGYLYLENSTFQDNTAANYGSAIHVNKGFDSNGYQSIAYASIKNTRFINNKVNIIGEYGGAVSAFGEVNNVLTKVDIINSLFKNNAAEYGGAVCGLFDSYINITDTIFKENTAKSYGGAIYSMDQIFIYNSNFESNTANQGGAIAIYMDAIINNSTFTNNHANLSGGAIRSNGDTLINNSIFTSNTAPYGGAVSAEGKQGFFTANKVILDNSILTANNAIEYTNNSGGLGGAVYIEGGCDITNSILEDNNAYYDGGAISINNYNNSVNIKNNIIVNNHANQQGTQVEIEELNNITINNNWWGTNNPSNTENLIKLYNTETETYSTYTPDTWIILNTEIDKTNLNPTESTQIKLTLLNNKDETQKIPEREIKLTTNGGILNPETTTITQKTTTEYTSPINPGIYTLKTILDNEEQETIINVGANNITIPTIIPETNITINTTETIKISVNSDNGTVNTGTIRVYYNGRTIGTSTVKNGISEINHQLEPGTYTITAYYLSDGIYENTNQTILLTIINNTPATNNTNTTNNTNNTNTTPINNTNNTPTTKNTTTITTTTLLTGTYGEDINFTGKLTDTEGNPLLGHHIALNITRLSNGLSKTYWVTTDYNGNYNIPINLAPGTYTIKSQYYGENNNPQAEEQLTNLIIYQQGQTPTNKTQTIITIDTFTSTQGENKNLTGKLLDNTGNPIIGHHINIKITRLSNGLSKTYPVTTDYNGQYTLPINLARGNYQITCTYDGTDTYAQSTNTRTITIN